MRGLACAADRVIGCFDSDTELGRAEMTTSMSIQRAVLTHQKDMVLHANATFPGFGARRRR
jgi:hypothetical protein